MITGYRRFQITSSQRAQLERMPTISWCDETDIAAVLQRGATKVVETFMLEGAQTTWPTREYEAECYSYRGAASVNTLRSICVDHLKMGECSCGIYIMKGPDSVQGYKQWPVLAAITGWGVYTEHEKLWRMQYARIEHIWIDPKARNWRGIRVYGTIAEQLKERYEVGVEVLEPEAQVCCGQRHEVAYWPAKGGPISICKMSTEHIVNALRYISGRHDVQSAAWKRVFEVELERRAPTLGTTGKRTVVSF